MSSKKQVAILVGIIGVLLVLLAGSLGYILAKNATISVADSNIENTSITNDLEKLKILYDAKIADKTNNYQILKIQKDSIAKLAEALQNSEENAKKLLKYKTEYQNLESKMKVLVDEISILTGRKKIVNSKTISKSKAVKKEDLILENKIKIESNQLKIGNKNNSNFSNNAISQPKETNNQSEDGEPTKIAAGKITSDAEKIIKSDKNLKITISNIQTKAYISKSAYKKTETTTANRADFFEIEFTIVSNSDFNGFEKVFYFQIINPNNSVIGQRKTEYFDNQLLTYSFSKSFFYTGQTVKVLQEYLVKDLNKGYYFINVFDKGDLVGKTSLKLD